MPSFRKRHDSGQAFPVGAVKVPKDEMLKTLSEDNHRQFVMSKAYVPPMTKNHALAIHQILLKRGFVKDFDYVNYFKGEPFKSALSGVYSMRNSKGEPLIVALAPVNPRDIHGNYTLVVRNQDTMKSPKILKDAGEFVRFLKEND